MASNMSTLIDLIKTERDTQELCISIIKDLKCKNLLLVNFIENLQNLLVSPEVILRRGGIEVLSSVLNELPTDFLDSQEIVLLTDFYCERLRDHHSLIPAILKGFLALVKTNEFPNGQAAKIFTHLNLHFVCQSQLQADRSLCYQILNTIINIKPEELQALGPDFVCGYLTFIDSERDPRNLMYIFENLPKFYQNFSLGHLLEDAFEASACYFPIDFRTSVSDPRGICREDLSNALLPCLTAVHDFAAFCIQLALEKLTSDLEVAKIDSFILLKTCFMKFPPDKLSSHLNEVAEALFSEMKLDQIDSKILQAYVDCSVSVIQFLNNNKKFEELNKVMNNIFSSIENFLVDVHLSMFIYSVKFIVCISDSCEFACVFLTKKTIQKLLSLQIDSNAEFSTLLQTIKLLLIPCINHNINCAEQFQDWSQVSNLFLESCESNGVLKTTAIECTSSIIQSLNFEQRSRFYRVLCCNIKKETNSSLKKMYIIFLRNVAEHYSGEIETVFKDEFHTNGISNVESKKVVFQCLCTLAPLPNFLKYLPEMIKEYLNNDISELAVFVIECLKDLIYFEKGNVNFLSKLHYEVNIAKHLIDWWHDGCNALLEDINEIFDDELVAKNLQLIITLVIKVLKKTVQKEISLLYYQFTLERSKRFMNSFQYLSTNDNLDTPKIHCSLSVITFESIINGLLSSLVEEIVLDSLSQLSTYLCTLSVYCSRPLCCSVACRSIATILNKLSDGPEFNTQVISIYEFVSSAILSNNSALKINTVNLLIYVTKSLLLRGYSEMNLWFDQLLSLLDDNIVGPLIADGFRLIFLEEENFLNASCHFTVKLFYRQRLFMYMIPKLVDNANKNNNSVNRINYAISTVDLLQGVPQIIVNQYFKRIVQLLMELFKVNCKPELTYDVLEKITTMLKENASVFESYIETFIPKLLMLSLTAPQMNIRIAALKCLRYFSKLNPIVILPFKSKVIFEMAPCLDDKKRLVRKEAVKTRNRWCVLGVE